VKSTVSRGLKSSDRAAEAAFRHAANERGPSTSLAPSDSEIIEAWLGQRANQAASDAPDGHDQVTAGGIFGDDQ